MTARRVCQFTSKEPRDLYSTAKKVNLPGAYHSSRRDA